MASLTKIMTFHTALHLVDRFGVDIENELVYVDEESASVTGTSASLVEGDLLTVEQLFYGLMLPSGNDAAHLLAHFFGSILLKTKSEKPVQIGTADAALR